MEMLSIKGVIGMVKAVASMFPGNMHYKQSLMGTDEKPFKEHISKILDTSLNNDTIRERLLRKNPYLFSLYYWIVFDNGFLHAADLFSQTFLKSDSPSWEKFIGRQCVEALVGASISKGKYSKSQWKELSKLLKKGDAKKVIEDALREVQGRRGRKSTVILLEEMLLAEKVSVLIPEIEKVLYEWKQLEGTDVILPYIFAALGIGPNDLINDLETFGLMFETLCVRDLRVYADVLKGEVYHYRDKDGLECDAVIHLRNGQYGLVEIKLGGHTKIEEGVVTLNELEKKIDTTRMRSPSFKMVLTGTEAYAYRRKDGVYVVPIGCLKD